MSDGVRKLGIYNRGTSDCVQAASRFQTAIRATPPGFTCLPKPLMRCDGSQLAAYVFVKLKMKVYSQLVSERRRSFSLSATVLIMNCEPVTSMECDCRNKWQLIPLKPGLREDPGMCAPGVGCSTNLDHNQGIQASLFQFCHSCLVLNLATYHPVTFLSLFSCLMYSRVHLFRR